MVRTLHRGRFLSSAGASIVAICAFMKLLMPSLDAATGAHLFANQGILAGTFFFLVGLLWSRTKPVWQWSLFVLCAFTLWLGISSFLGVAGIGLMRTVEFASYVCVAVVAGYYIRGEISGRIVVGLVGGAAVAVAVWAFGQELLSLPELRESAEKYASQLEADKRADFIDRLMTREVFGPFTISNALAAFCVLVFFPLAACAVALRRNLYACLPAAVTALAVLVTLGLTRSKGGILAFACAAVVSLYFVLGHFGVRRWVRNTVLTVPLVAGVLGVLLLVTYAPSEMGGASAKVRLGYWQTASKMIAARPVSGHGTATFADRQMTFRPASATPAKHAHNDYLEIFAENGIVGFALFAVFLLGLFLSSRPASVGEEEETPESTGKAFEVQSEAPGTRVKPPVRAAILAAILCWVALSVALAMFGAADFDNLLAHVTEGSLAWAVLLVCTVLLPPAATYALARFYMPERHSVALRYGIFSSAVGFLAHSLIDFNLYNQGASLAFFALAGILSGPVHVFKGVSRFTVVMLAGTVVMFFASVFFSGQLGEVSRMNSLSSAVTEGNAKLSPQQLKMLHDMLADPPEPLLIDLADLYAERGYVAGLFAAEREEFASVALANYENAILLNPYRHRYPLEVAVMLGHLEQYELSQEYFEKAAELAPNSVRVLREYAVMLDKSGRKARASELLERADSLERLRMELEGVSAD